VIDVCNVQMQSLRSPANGGAVKKRRFIADLNNKRTKGYKLHAEEVQKALKRWQQHLNSINTDPAPIFVENNVDLEGPPQVPYCFFRLNSICVELKKRLYYACRFCPYLFLVHMAKGGSW